MLPNIEQLPLSSNFDLVVVSAYPSLSFGVGNFSDKTRPSVVLLFRRWSRIGPLTPGAWVSGNSPPCSNRPLSSQRFNVHAHSRHLRDSGLPMCEKALPDPGRGSRLNPRLNSADSLSAPTGRPPSISLPLYARRRWISVHVSLPRALSSRGSYLYITKDCRLGYLTVPLRRWLPRL